MPAVSSMAQVSVRTRFICILLLVS